MNNDLIKIISKFQSIWETNETKFICCILMYNEAAGFCVLNSQNIDSLTIDDNLYTPFYSAILNVKNDTNNIELGFSPELKKIATSFQPLNNGTDKVFIFFCPYNNENKIETKFNISLMMNIMTSEDIFINERKVKQYVLADINKIFLENIYGQFATSKYAYKLLQEDFKFKNINTFNIESQSFNTQDKNKLINLSNDERSIPTGYAIALLLKEAFGEHAYINTDNWDYGGPKIFYSNTPNNNYIDVLNDLITLHNSRENSDKCYLHYDYNIEKDYYEWSFYGLGTLYHNMITNNLIANDYIITFKDFDINLNSSDTADKYITQTGDFGDKTSMISEFYLKDFDTNTNLGKIKTSIVYNYDEIDKSFIIDNESSNYSNILKTFKNTFSIDNKTRYHNTPVSINQKNSYNIKHLINLYNENTNISIARNKTINDLLFLNNTLEFTTYGNLLLHAGNFINLKMKNAPVDNLFINKLLGEYLITSVTHTFSDKTYNNTLNVVKPFYLTKPFEYDIHYKI